VKRHFLHSLIFIFLGSIIFSSCGNSPKPDATLAANDKTAENKSVDSTLKIKEDSLKNAALMAEANIEKEKLEETKVKEKEQSFNPPHIPVFKEEKEKANSQTIKKNNQSKKAAKKSKPQPTLQSSVKPKEAVSKARSLKNQNTEIVWRRNFYSFGDITQGDTVYFKFEFTNVGDFPLEIESATASCGCTHPSFSFIPVESNKKGEIKGMYISDETKKGTQNAMIMVTANTEPSIHKLYIDGNVLLPEGNSKDSGGDIDSKGN